jgi:hypothetical protein
VGLADLENIAVIIISKTHQWSSVDAKISGEINNKNQFASISLSIFP